MEKHFSRFLSETKFRGWKITTVFTLEDNAEGLKSRDSFTLENNTEGLKSRDRFTLENNVGRWKVGSLFIIEQHNISHFCLLWERNWPISTLDHPKSQMPGKKNGICSGSSGAIPARVLSAWLLHLDSICTFPILYRGHCWTQQRKLPPILGLRNRNFAAKSCAKALAAFCPPLYCVFSSFPSVHVHPNKFETNAKQTTAISFPSSVATVTAVHPRRVLGTVVQKPRITPWSSETGRVQSDYGGYGFTKTSFGVKLTQRFLNSTSTAQRWDISLLRGRALVWNDRYRVSTTCRNQFTYRVFLVIPLFYGVALFKCLLWTIQINCPLSVFSFSNCSAISMRSLRLMHGRRTRHSQNMRKDTQGKTIEKMANLRYSAETQILGQVWNTPLFMAKNQVSNCPTKVYPEMMMTQPYFSLSPRHKTISCKVPWRKRMVSHFAMNTDVQI